MDDELHRIASAKVRGAGQRYTAGRRALVGLLAGAARPLSLPDVLAAAPGLPQSSAYRHLAVLEHAGVVHRVVAPGGYARYELSEDLTRHHHHLVCTRCGAVEDVEVPPRLERAMEQAITEMAAESGFALEGHRLDLVGRCASCA